MFRLIQVYKVIIHFLSFNYKKEVLINLAPDGCRDRLVEAIKCLKCHLIKRISK